MSALPPKADLFQGYRLCLLMTQSGHSLGGSVPLCIPSSLIDGLLRGTRRFNFRYTAPEVQKPCGGYAISAVLVFVETDLRDVALGGLLFEVNFPGKLGFRW